MVLHHNLNIILFIAADDTNVRTHEDLIQLLLDAATEVKTTECTHEGPESQQAQPAQEPVPEMQVVSDSTHLELLTGPSTCTGKIRQYCDKLVKFLDTLVSVAKRGYTLEQMGETSAENLAFAKEILFAAGDVEERLEYLHMYGQKIMEEYQQNNTESTQEQQQQKQQPSALSSKKKVVRKKRHFHPEAKKEILKPYFGPKIVIDDVHNIMAKPIDDSTRPQYKNPKNSRLKWSILIAVVWTLKVIKKKVNQRKKERLL